MADINIKAKITTDTTEATKGVENFENKIKGAGNSAKSSGQDFGKLKDTVGSLGPVGEKATAQMGSLNNAFNILRANPIIAVFTIIAGVIIAIVQRMSEMEAVSDALGKAFGTLSGIINAFVSKVLTPLIDGFVWLIENSTKGIVKVLQMMGIGSEEAAEKFGQLNEELDNMEDAQKDNEIAMHQANRRLQEAREIAADANVPIKDRIKALRDAAKEELEQGKIVMEFNRGYYANKLETYARENNARKETIALIQKGTIESLLAARAQLLADKQGSHDRINELNKYIEDAEDKQAELARLSKKTNAQINAIEREAEREREQARKEAEERRKAREEKAEADRIARQKAAWDARTLTPQQIPEVQQLTDAAKARNEHEAFLDRMNADRLNKAQATSAVITAIDQKQTADAITLSNQRAQAQTDALRMTGEAFNALADVVGRQTAAGKALSTAQALINTYLGVTQVLANKTVIPEPFGTIQKIASVATILASGFSAVRNINKVSVPGGGGATPSASAVTATAPLTPSAGTTTLDAQTIQNIGNAASGGVNRSYVLETDIRNNSERSARLQRAARLA